MNWNNPYRHHLRAPAGEDGAGAAAGETVSGAGGGATAAAAAAAAGNGADQGPWYKPFNLPKEDSDYIEGKGARDLPTLIKATRDFETQARARDVLKKPDPAKLMEWDGWKELGWEPDIAKYAIKADKEKHKFQRDDALWDTIQKIGHANRVPLAAIQAMHDGAMDHWAKQIATVEADGAKLLSESRAALRTEWGQDYDSKMERAKRAAATLARGVGAQDFKALEEAVGGSVTLTRMFATLGEKMGEDQLRTGESSSIMTPEAARSERLRLEADADWMKAFTDERNPLHKANVARRMQLLELEAKGQRAA